jgi:hypothetical protein
VRQLNKATGHYPEYMAPEMVTYNEDDLPEELGPAQACTNPCPAP